MFSFVDTVKVIFIHNAEAQSVPQREFLQPFELDYRDKRLY